MDLLGRVAIIVLVVIVAATVAFMLIGPVFSGPLTSQQAVQLVLKDMRNSTPDANISVITVQPSTLKTGSWNIVLSVVYNASKPCPTLFIETFDYPALGFVPSVDNLYTSHCVIYGISTAPSYVISSPYIAIARSYNQSFAPVTSYVKTFGYNNTVVHARFLSQGGNATPLNGNFTSVWLVNYTAKNAPYSEYVVMSSSGTIVANYTSQA